MKNINLKNEDLAKQRAGGRKMSLVLSVVVITISLSLYGVCFGLNLMANNNKKKTTSEIKSIEKYLGNEKFVELFDFNTRLIDLKSKISDQGLLPQSKNIINLSANTISGVFFVDFKFEDDKNLYTYTVTAEFPDYITLIKQIKAYKQTKNLDNFILKSAELVENKNDEEILTAVFEFEVNSSKNTTISKGDQEKTF